MRGLLFLLACCYSVFALGQVQKGIAVLQNSGKKGLPNVSINIDNAIPTTSDINGEFAIEVPNHNPGNRLVVQDISHPEYLLINKREVENWVYSPQKSYRIDFCSPDEYYSRVDNYYHIGNENYKNELQKKLKELEDLKREAKLRQEDYAQRYQELYNNYIAQTKKLGGYCEVLAAVNVDYLDTLESTAIKYVDEGRIDLAISLYEQANLKEKYENAANQHRTINEELREAIPQLDRYFTILMLKGGDEQIEKAGKILKLIADYDSLDEKRNREYIDFARGHRKYDVALKYINKTLSYIKNPYTKIEYLLRKASILDERHADDAVFGIYAKIDTIFASLPNDDINYVAIQIIYLDYLGRLFFRRGLYNNAYSCYKKRIYYLTNCLKDTDNRRNALKESYYMMLESAIEMDSLIKIEEVKAVLDSLPYDSQDSLFLSLNKSLYHIKRKQFNESLHELKMIENNAHVCLEKDFYGSIGLYVSFISDLLASYARVDSISEAERVIEEGDNLLLKLSDIQKYELGGTLALYYTNKMYLRLRQGKYNDVISLMDTCALYKQDTTKDLYMCQNWMSALLGAGKDYKIWDYSKTIYVQTIVHPENMIANELFSQFCSIMNMAGFISKSKDFELKRWDKIKNQNNSTIKMQCLLNIANSYFRDSRLDSAAYYIRKCDKYANRLRNTPDSAWCKLFDESKFYYYLGIHNFKAAQKLFSKRQNTFQTTYIGDIRIRLCMAFMNSNYLHTLNSIEDDINSLHSDDTLHYNIANMELNICKAIECERKDNYDDALKLYYDAYNRCRILDSINSIRYGFWMSYIEYKIAQCCYKTNKVDFLWDSIELSIQNYKYWYAHKNSMVSYLNSNINPITLLYKDDIVSFSNIFSDWLRENPFSASAGAYIMRAINEGDVDKLVLLINTIANRKVPLSENKLYKDILPLSIKKYKEKEFIEDEIYDTIVSILEEL